jgi:sarcosine oxidase subunit gamma
VAEAARTPGPGLSLTERSGIEIVQVATWPTGLEETARILTETVGVPPAGNPNAVATGAETSILSIGPGRWWVVRPAASPLAATLAASLPKDIAAVLELSAGRCVFVVSGARSRDLLAKYLPLDLAGAELSPGHCAQSAMAHIGVLVHVRGAEAFELFVTRSFARHLWEILSDAALEFATD